MLKRNAGGHFVAAGRINGTPVTFLVDTGATNVTMSLEVARANGTKHGPALRTATAVGVTTAYATRLASVELAGLAARDVSGVMAPDMPGDTALLGMSFISRCTINM